MRHRAPLLIVVGLILAIVGTHAPTSDAQATKADERELLRLEQHMMGSEQQLANKAEGKRDALDVGTVYADDWQGIPFTGELKGKEDLLKELASGALTNESSEATDMKIRLYGDTGLVTGKFAIKKGKYHGRDVSGDYRFTDVFVKRDGAWKCVSSQLTPIPKH
jgi:ketosteroid isomerase-like protein